MILLHKFSQVMRICEVLTRLCGFDLRGEKDQISQRGICCHPGDRHTFSQIVVNINLMTKSSKLTWLFGLDSYQGVSQNIPGDFINVVSIILLWIFSIHSDSAHPRHHSTIGCQVLAIPQTPNDTAHIISRRARS